MKLFILLFVCLISLSCQGQNTDFYVDKIINHTDINYDLFKVIDTIDSEDIYDQITSKNSNRFVIYVLKRIEKGISKKRDTLDRCELIIFKIDKGQILESYYIPLTWNEPPLSNVIMYSKKVIPLNDIVDIDEIGFVPINRDGFNIMNSGKCILNNQKTDE